MDEQCHKSFQWTDISQFNEYFIKDYNEESDEVYFFEIDVQYHERLLELHNSLPFLPEKNEDWKSRKAWS